MLGWCDNSKCQRDLFHNSFPTNTISNKRHCMLFNCLQLHLMLWNIFKAIQFLLSPIFVPSTAFFFSHVKLIRENISQKLQVSLVLLLQTARVLFIRFLSKYIAIFLQDPVLSDCSQIECVMSIHYTHYQRFSNLALMLDDVQGVDAKHSYTLLVKTMSHQCASHGSVKKT